MDNQSETFKIAAASSDGIVVNQHFGHAAEFYVYTIQNGAVQKPPEVRQVIPVCHMGEHDENQLAENLRQFQDCRYLLASRIGMGAAAKMEQLGITPMEIPEIIEEAIEKILVFGEIQNLLERN